ncbi:MAG TPA: flagellar hook-length control protein FliK [Solirubrobacteraceae bacterium]|nr:flagellar hook-length control protein FliK [Solirubrobacteraceae bacterium]
MTGALGPATTGDPGGRDDIGATVDASGGVPFATGASPTGDARQDAEHRGDEPLLPAPPADRAPAATTAAAQGRTGDAAPAPPGAADSAIAPAPTSTLANAAAPRGDTDLTPSPAALGAAAGSPAAAAAITPAAPPVTVAATGATTLAHAPRALAATIDLAVRGGISRARLRLSPEHLGGIEVRLRSGPNGIEAQLVADSQQAAGTLTAAAAELADRLRSHGIELARLDVRCGADGDSAARDSGADAARQQPASGHGTEAGDSAPAAITTLTLLDGVLVDVLA